MFKEMTFDDLLKFVPMASMALSGYAAYIAYKVYQSYSQRQFLNKQIEVVTNLLEILNTDHFLLGFTTFRGASTRSEITSVNIFEIFHVNSQKRDHQLDYENSPVYLDVNYNQVLNIKKFIDNPFTPKKIADSLINFYSTHYDSVNHIALGNAEISYSVVITTSIHQPRTNGSFIKEGDKYIQGDATALKSWLSFLNCTLQLKREFEIWFSKNGIDDLNIRTDFKKSSWTSREITAQ